MTFFVGVSVRLSEDDYRVNEDDGTVRICVVRDGVSADPITVNVTSREASPANATGKQTGIRKCVYIRGFLI